MRFNLIINAHFSFLTSIASKRWDGCKFYCLMGRGDIKSWVLSSYVNLEMYTVFSGIKHLKRRSMQAWVRLIFLFHSIQSQKVLIRLNSWLTIALQELIQIGPMDWLEMDFWNLIQIDPRLKNLPEYFDSNQLTTQTFQIDSWLK